MYLLDNAAPQAPDRFDALAEIFDPGTIRHLESIGIGPGWRCLEIGAGGGSIARWMADMVGPTGQVLATDIDPRHLDAGARANLDILRHDISTDAVPAGPYDVVHARLVLMHLRDPRAAFAAMVEALAPGGWIVLEDFGMPRAVGAGQTMMKTAKAVRQVFTEGGVQVDGGDTLADRLRHAGLGKVATDSRSFVWRGGSAGAKLLRANFVQLRDAVLRAGVTANEFAADLARLDDPSVSVPSPVMWAAWGQRGGVD
jgi:SAM-dependent methyltransferase